MQNIQRLNKSADILTNKKEDQLTEPKVWEEDSFLTVISRARKAAHMVAEKDIWGNY